MSCGELFQEIIDNQKENLKYIRQLGSAAKAFELEQYDKFKALIIGVLGTAHRDKLQEILGERPSYKSLVGALQFISILKPSVFGAILEGEIKKLRDFFTSEQRKLNAVIGLVQQMIDRLLSDWSPLDDLDTLQEKYQKQLNDFFNKKAPASLRSALSAKTKLISAENMIYSGDVFLDEGRFSSLLSQAKSDVLSAKGHLGSDEISIVENVIRLIILWDEIQRFVARLTRTDSESYEGVSIRFDQVGENFLRFLESFHVAIMNLSEAVEILDSTEGDIQRAWSAIHKHLILAESDLGVLWVSDLVHSAIKRHIETKGVVDLDLPLPFVGGRVDSKTFSEWERRANIHRPFKTTWSSSYDEVLSLVEEVDASPTVGVSGAVKSIYSPLSQSIIDTYRVSTRGIWRHLFSVVSSINNILARIVQGKRVAGTITGQLYELRMHLMGIGDAISVALNFFNTQDPEGQLREELGLSGATSAIIAGFVSFFDTLGLDHLSQLVDSGDLAGVFDTPEGEASNAGQLLKCLKSYKDVGALAQKYISEIKSIAAAEVQRKKKLEQTTMLLVEGAAKSQEERIKEMETLLENFNKSLEVI